MDAPKTIVQAMLDLLAQDTATFSQAADALKVKLVSADFVFDDTMVPGDFTLATFTGSAAKLVALNDQEVGYDPLTQTRFMQLIPPIGGWYYECTVAPDPTQTIYGAIVTTNDGVTLLGVEKLEVPVVIADVGDSVTLPPLRLSLPNAPFV